MCYMKGKRKEINRGFSSVSQKNNYNAIFQKDYWEKNRKRRMPQHPMIKAFVGPKIDYIKKYVRFLEDTKILDVGSGNGFFGYYFSKFCDVTGLDYSKYMLRMNPLEKLIQANAENLPFKDDAFDVVFSSALLHHVENPKEILEEYKRVSKKFVVIIEPNRNNPFMFIFSMMVREEWKALRFSLRYLENLSKGVHLKIISSCSMGAIVPNKTPMKLLPLFLRFDPLFLNIPFSFSNVLIAEKWSR